MFHSEFFPTPAAVIETMLAPHKEALEKGKLTILEPSAGKGDILDYIMQMGTYRQNNTKVYAIEQDPELAYILQGKSYPVIHTDFLTYSGSYHFDLIVMNPPFSKGAEHLLKAWEVLDQGSIVCLLNKQTYDNPFSVIRSHLSQLIDRHGSVEPLGSCFDTAERKTHVEVILVRLHKKPRESRFDYFAQLKADARPEAIITEDMVSGAVARQDVLGNLETYFRETEKAFIEYNKARARLKFYSDPLLNSHYDLDRMIKAAGEGRSNGEAYNIFLDELKGSAWAKVLDQTKVQRYMTSEVRKNFSKFSASQKLMDFTAANMEALFEMLFMNRHELLERAIVEVFDKLTSYDEKNKVHYEGWKTNSAYKVNRRVILPHWVRLGICETAHSLKTWGASFRLSSGAFIDDDIDKVLCFITGQKFEQCLTIRRALEAHFDQVGRIRTGDAFENTCESTFFHIKFWKKGTVHLEFRDLKHWELFNLRAAQGKKWLPEAE